MTNKAGDVEVHTPSIRSTISPLGCTCLLCGEVSRRVDAWTGQPVPSARANNTLVVCNDGRREPFMV